MESSLLSVSKIFTEKLLRIPDYQRGYAWGEKEVLDYWNDLLQLEDNKSHYVGVLTLEDVPSEIVNTWSEDHWIINKRGYKPYYIVDGQQRLTTTIILIQSIIEAVEEKFISEEDSSLNFTDIKEIKNKFIFLSKDKGVSRSYIFGYEKDNPSYEFLKTKIFQEHSSNHSQLEETIYTSNLQLAKELFKEKINTLSKGEVEDIYKKVTQHFVFNLYSLDKEIDTYVAFETMNNRGKVLSHLELLKNRLIYLTTKLRDEQYEKNSLRHSINECWKSIYHYLGKSKTNPLDDDGFLYSHFTLYFDNQVESPFNEYGYSVGYHRERTNYKDVLLDNIFSQKSLYAASDSSSALTSEFILNYVSSLKESVEQWYDIFNPDSEKLSNDVTMWLQKIHKIHNWELCAPAILSLFRTTNNAILREKFLRTVERAIFIENYIAFQFYVVSRNKWLEFAKKLNNNEITPEELISSINSLIDSSMKENRDIWIKYFSRNSDFYNWRGIKYTLFEYELTLLKKYKSDRSKLVWSEFCKTEPWSEYATVEHIYPQRPQAKYWIDRFNNLSADKRKKLRHSIGNLVPLSKGKNSKLSNKPFPDKVETGFKYGCYSENEIANNKDWTPQHIVDRTLVLIKFIDQRWKLGITSSTTGTDTYLNYVGLNEINKSK